MNNRTFWIFAGALSIIIAVQIAFFVRLRGEASAGSIRCRAVNAGLPLGPEDASIVVYRAGDRDRPVARGHPNNHIQVPAGIYDVQVLYTKSQDRQEAWLENVSVERGNRSETEVEFSAGQLVVGITAGARPAMATDGLIQVVPRNEANRVIASFLPGEVAILRAGTYDLRIALLADAREKTVQWLRGLTIPAGLLVRQDVAFHQGQLLISAINAGKAIRTGSVALTVYRAGDPQEEVVERGLAGVPLVLAPGRYDARATFIDSSDAASRWIRSVEVPENAAIQRTVDFSSGTALVRAFMTGGRELPEFQAYVYFYKVDDHQQPVTYVPAGHPVTVSAGRYDLRAQFFRSHDQPDIWKRNVDIRAGETLDERVSFPSGTLLIRALEPGGAELVGDNVFLFFYRAGEGRTPVARARSAEEVTLTAGSYDIRAVDSRERFQDAWLKEVPVVSGQTRRATITFAPSRH